MKKLILLFVIAATLLLYGCTTFYFPWPFANTTTVTTAPVSVDGTITFVENDYYGYPYYSTPNYYLDNIDQYNDVVLATRDHIRHANVQLQTTVYRIGGIIPGMTQTIIQSSASGSGVVFLEKDGYYYFLTNYHVIDAGDHLADYQILAYGDATPQTAELVCASEELDLAVLRFAKGLRTDIELINVTTRLFTRFTPGELVFAVGNPLGVDNNVTFGEFIGLESIANVGYKVILHSATIHEGSSGGALVDIDGNLVGVNAWGTDSSDEQSFAIPVYIVNVFLVNNGLA